MYKPINNLSKLISDDTSSNDYVDILMLENVFKTLKEENLKYTEQLSTQKVLYLNELITLFLKGVDKETALSKYGEYTSEYNAVLFDTEKQYLCIIASIDNYVSKFIKTKDTNRQWIDRHSVINAFRCV